MTAKLNSGAWFVAAALLSSWAVSSASDEAPRRDVPMHAAAASVLPPEAIDAAAQVARLAARTRESARERVARGRNPFAFDGERRIAAPRVATTSHRDDHPVIAAPIMTDVVATPAAPTLAAVAEIANGTATAVIAFDGALHYAARGALIADRYRVETIFEDAVDIFDLSLGMNLRLALRRPR